MKGRKQIWKCQLFLLIGCFSTSLISLPGVQLAVASSVECEQPKGTVEDSDASDRTQREHGEIQNRCMAYAFLRDAEEWTSSRRRTRRCNNNMWRLKNNKRRTIQDVQYKAYNMLKKPAGSEEKPTGSMRLEGRD